jgi:NAD-dependent SIR2 family protein deacetylase
MSQSKPSLPHFALAKLERLKEQNGHRTDLVTQNVDGLHQKAGHRSVVELHGNVEKVVCVRCRQAEMPRDHFQEMLRTLNAAWLTERAFVAVDEEGQQRADGDRELNLDKAVYDQFQVPDCPNCGSDGVWKPSVVFFGESIPPAVTAQAAELAREAVAILAMGSSLTVYSAFRLARAAQERSLPLAIINVGPTRADSIASLKVEAQVGPLLNEMVEALKQG